MIDFANKWQAFLSLLVILVSATIAWGQLDTRVLSLEKQLALERASRSEVVTELRKIRDELVLLRINVATTNQKLESHLLQND